MIVLRDRKDISRIANQHIHCLLDLRYQQLGTFHDALLLVIEDGDSVEEVERLCGLPILYDPFSNVPLGHPDYSPPFDYIEAHHANGTVYCFEAHADTDDDGLGITLFVPTEEGVPAILLALCTKFSAPAPPPP